MTRLAHRGLSLDIPMTWQWFISTELLFDVILSVDSPTSIWLGYIYPSPACNHTIIPSYNHTAHAPFPTSLYLRYHFFLKHALNRRKVSLTKNLPIARRIKQYARASDNSLYLEGFETRLENIVPK